MNILIACEESQRVCVEFRKKGHNAFSCDVLPCSGGHPEWHIQADVLRILDAPTWFYTMAGTYHSIYKWDMIIAFPPCTYLSVVGSGYFNIEKYGEKAIERYAERDKAYLFFMRFINANCEKIAVENPVGYCNSHYRKPDQIIHPYYFAENEKDVANYQLKRTCLWLKNLPLLKRVSYLEKPGPIYVDHITGKKRNYVDAISGTSKDGQRLRSQTFPGIARAMAEQWG